MPSTEASREFSMQGFKKGYNFHRPRDHLRLAQNTQTDTVVSAKSSYATASPELDQLA